jgi:DNA-binding MarR family transcriptional regulator
MPKTKNLYEAIKSIFHEPSRLAIMSALCNAGADGLSFKELKEECELTDGNLSRHLKALEEARAVRLKKTFVRARPLTTVLLTDRGREHFLAYLQALEDVLKQAAAAVGEEERDFPPLARSPARA